MAARAHAPAPPADDVVAIACELLHVASPTGSGGAIAGGR